MNAPWLTILTLVPLAGGALAAAAPARKVRWARAAAFVSSLAALALAAALWLMFDKSRGGMQFIERARWASSVGLEYHLGVDGLGLLMVFLSAIITPFAIAASWKSEAKLHFALIAFLESGLFGAFTALNFIHWFIFWELSLIPAFFLIKLWGGPGRTRAANQFLIYTLAGSVAMLLSFLALYAATGTFDFQALAALASKGGLENALWAKLGGGLFASKQTLALAVFIGVFLGLAVKAPIMPFHTWLPSAYAEAPTGAVMLLTGAMSKMGVYGFIRLLLPLFPAQLRALQTPLLWLAAGTIVFSAAAALAQTDLKRMLAYTSITHVNYCLLGVFAAGAATAASADAATALNGALLQMFNHGLTAAALFYFVGLIEERAGGIRGLGDFGGLRVAAPALSLWMGVALFASLGLPGLSGFVGEFLIFKGALPLAPAPVAVAALGLLLGAILVLTLWRRVFDGPLAPRWDGWSDLTWNERLAAAPALALVFALGVAPQLVVGALNQTVLAMVRPF